MEKPRWASRISKRTILVIINLMKVIIELFGASRDFSDQNSLELDIENGSSIKEVRNKILDYLDINFKGNENFIKIAHNH